MSARGFGETAPGGGVLTSVEVESKSRDLGNDRGYRVARIRSEKADAAASGLRLRSFASPRMTTAF